MKKINKELTKELLEQAIRKSFNTNETIIVYDPIYKNESLDLNKIQILNGLTNENYLILLNGFDNTAKEEAELALQDEMDNPDYNDLLQDEIKIIEDEWLQNPIRYENKEFNNSYELIDFIVDKL